MSRRRALVGVLAPAALALSLAACSVEVVDDARTPAPGASAGDAGHPVPSPSGTAREAGTGDATAPGAGGTGAPGGPGLPSRDDLRALTTGQTACAGGDVSRERAGDAVEVTDGCGTLTVTGADSVVVAGDVDHLVVAGAGARVAVRSVATVTITAAAVTVTWEDGSPVVTDDGTGSSYGAVGAG